MPLLKIRSGFFLGLGQVIDGSQSRLLVTKLLLRQIVVGDPSVRPLWPAPIGQ